MESSRIYTAKHGSAVLETFSMIFDELFYIPLEKISEGDEITLRIMRERLKSYPHQEGGFDFTPDEDVRYPWGGRPIQREAGLLWVD